MRIYGVEDSVIGYFSGHRFDLDQELDRIEQEVRSSRDKHSCFIDGESEVKKLKKVTKEAAPESTGHEYSAADLAKELGMDGSDLRKKLRTVGAKKPGKQWVWPKKSDEALDKIRKELKADGGTKKDKPAKKLKKSKGGEKGE